MLTALDQSISSPGSSSSSSPRFSPYQHASPSLRVITTTSRRKSHPHPPPYSANASPAAATISTPPAAARPAPTRGLVHYVDRGTQYSPSISTLAALAMRASSPSKADAARSAQENQRPRRPSQQAQPPRPSPPQTDLTAPSVADAAAPVAHKTALEGQSPSMKKRTSPHEIPAQDSAHANGDADAPSKRTKEAGPAVKLLPARYELCDVADMVVLIANMISELIATNDELPLRNGVLTRFHSRTPPGISVVDYLQRLAKHATLTPPLLLSMVYYIDRLCSLYPAFTINTLTVHRFLITAATVAAKGLSDSFWNNATYARVGGIRIAELGMLELEFLYRVDWKIVPNPEVLIDYYRGLIERSDLYEMADEESPSDGDASELTSPATAATDEKWQAWMDDVSKEKAAQEGGEPDRPSHEATPQGEPDADKEMA